MSSLRLFRAGKNEERGSHLPNKGEREKNYLLSIISFSLKWLLQQERKIAFVICGNDKSISAGFHGQHQPTGNNLAC